MDNWLIDGLMDIPNKLLSFFDMIMELLSSVYSSLLNLLEMLQGFDEDIIAMTEACESGTFAGMPIMGAIGMFRYLVGDLAFMMIHFIGCLFTVYKLVVLLFDAIDSMSLQVSGVSSKNFLSNLLFKFLK